MCYRDNNLRKLRYVGWVENRNHFRNMSAVNESNFRLRLACSIPRSILLGTWSTEIAVSIELYYIRSACLYIVYKLCKYISIIRFLLLLFRFAATEMNDAAACWRFLFTVRYRHQLWNRVTGSLPLTRSVTRFFKCFQFNLRQSESFLICLAA